MDSDRILHADTRGQACLQLLPILWLEGQGPGCRIPGERERLECVFDIPSQWSDLQLARAGRTDAMILALFLLAALSRTYWPLTPSQLAAEDPAHWSHCRTHISVEGFLNYKKVEEDGDTHLRICETKVAGMDRRWCIVAECVPALACKAPPIGSRVRVRGVSRFDAEKGHRWWEVHPVEVLEVLP